MNLTSKTTLIFTALVSGFSFTTFAQTTFVGGSFNDDLGQDGLVGVEANWETDDAIPVNELPNTTNGYSSSTPGILNANATVDGSEVYSNLHIRQTGGAVTQDDQGANSYNFAGGSYLMEGGTWQTRRGLGIDADQTFTVDGGDWAQITGGSGDSATTINADGVLNIESGSFTISTDSLFNRGGTFSVNGGTVDVLTTFGNASFNGSGGTTNFNGGTTTINNLNFAGGTGLMNFGGTSSGSVSAATLAGNYTFDWFAGSQMSLTITGFNQASYEGLFSSGDLLFEGSNGGAFGDNFSVSGETLTLIPEPSSITLMGLAGVAMVLYRRRKYRA